MKNPRTLDIGKGITFLSVAIIFVCAALLAVKAWSPPASKQVKNKEREIVRYYGPTVDYEEDAGTSAHRELKQRQLRQLRSERYLQRAPQPLGEIPPGMTMLYVQDHKLIDLPALPTGQSDTVIIGEVTEAHAHLSSDKTAAYSEFTVNIKEVLKDNAVSPLSIGNSIQASREGGVVRFKDGRLLKYFVTSQGMPEEGQQYVFFLKFNIEAQDYPIVTAYELKDNKVVPIDGAEIKESSGKLSFAAYEGKDRASFINAVKEAIINPPQSPNRRRGLEQ